MKPASLFLPCLLILCLAGGLGWIIWKAYDFQEMAVIQAHRQAEDLQKLNWASADAARMLKLAAETKEREAAWAAEQLQALGGPVDAATKNPALNIGQMIEQTALACAPPGTKVTVSVDRFTEFDAALLLPEALPLARLAEISKNLLQHTEPYVHSLRFIAADQVLAHLEASAIESITNWNTVATADAQALIVAADAPVPPPSIAETGGTPDQPAAEDLNPAQAGLQAAQQTFQHQLKDHLARLNAFPQSLNQAARIETIQSPAQFKIQISFLGQIDGQLAAERAFFLNQSADLERACRARGLDPLLVTIIKREFDQRNQGAPALYAGVFDALSAYLGQVRTFLATMDGRRGEWDYSSDTGLIQFSSAEVHDLYVRESGRLAHGAQSVEKAFQALARFKPAN